MSRNDGLFAATYTPFTSDDQLNLPVISPFTEHLIATGVNGLFVCGSTGEGMSLTVEERCQTAAAFIAAAAERIPTIVHVGHNCLSDAAALSRHAAEQGATAVAACSPSYHRPATLADLVEAMADLASETPQLPFYYYHIPSMTGVDFRMIDFLKQAANRIPNLQGLKYTAPTLDDFQQCLAFDNGRFHMMWGVDEMLMSAWAAGATAAVGSTYNIAAPIYRQLIDDFKAGNLIRARERQNQAIAMVRTVQQVAFHPGMKAVLRSLGVDCGACRPPQPHLSTEDGTALLAELKDLGFYQWVNQEAPS